jgi:hypothetical protein
MLYEHYLRDTVNTRSGFLPVGAPRAMATAIGSQLEKERAVCANADAEAAWSSFYMMGGRTGGVTPGHHIDVTLVEQLASGPYSVQRTKPAGGLSSGPTMLLNKGVSITLDASTTTTRTTILNSRFQAVPLWT